MLAMDSCTPTYYPWEVLFADRHVFTVTPRDVAGNEGPTSDEFVVTAPESGCGCSLAHRSPPDRAQIALAGILLLLLLRGGSRSRGYVGSRGRAPRLLALLVFLGACASNNTAGVPDSPQPIDAAFDAQCLACPWASAACPR
jgi:hypothetical protein